MIVCSIGTYDVMTVWGWVGLMRIDYAESILCSWGVGYVRSKLLPRVGCERAMVGKGWATSPPPPPPTAWTGLENTNVESKLCRGRELIMIMSCYLKPDILKVIVAFFLLSFQFSPLNKYRADYNSGYVQIQAREVNT